MRELPKNKQDMAGGRLAEVYRYKGMIKELSTINFELAQMLVAGDSSGENLLAWFMTEIIRDLPRLVRNAGDVK